MAKDKSPGKGSIVSLTWRGEPVFGCPTSGCEFIHERKDRVAQHMRAGRHQVPKPEGPTRGSTATGSPAEPEVAPVPDESEKVTHG